MKKLILTLLLCTLVTVVIAQKQTTFILVRHAEKAVDGTEDPALNETGKLRSANLAEMLSNQEITALYATPYIRTWATIEPLATMKRLEIKNYDPHSNGKWLTSLVEKHAGGTIVISGHSNTIPYLANALIGSETFTQFDEKDYSNLIVIVTDKVGKGKLVRLKF